LLAKNNFDLGILVFDSKMKIFVVIAIVAASLDIGWSRPPVKGPHGDNQFENPAQGKPVAANDTAQDWDLGIEYNRYLQEVVQVLESDPEFR
jgi:hypothetical protein